MKKSLLATTFLMTFASASAFAHHPAADIVDPETYAMISENIADTPHADMTLGDMGSDMEGVGAAMEAHEEMGATAGEDRGQMPEHAPMHRYRHRYMKAQGDAGLNMGADEEVDTIGMLDDVTDALAE